MRHITIALSLLLAVTGCIEPLSGDIDPPEEDEGVTPPAAEDPGDMGQRGAGDMPEGDEEVEMGVGDDRPRCVPDTLRCADGQRERCEGSPLDFRSRPCDPGTMCVGEGVCARECELDPDLLCDYDELSFPHATLPLEPGCLGAAMVTLGEELLLVGDPCARDSSGVPLGALHLLSLDPTGASHADVVVSGDDVTRAFGASVLARPPDGAFVGAPGARGGQLFYLQGVSASTTAPVTVCALAQQELYPMLSSARALAMSPDGALLAVADPASQRLTVYAIPPSPCEAPLEVVAYVSPDFTSMWPGGQFSASIALLPSPSSGWTLLVGAPGGKEGEGALFVASIDPSSQASTRRATRLPSTEAETRRLGEAMVVTGAGVAIAAAPGSDGEDLFVVDASGRMDPGAITRSALEDQNYSLGHHLFATEGGFIATARRDGSPELLVGFTLDPDAGQDRPHYTVAYTVKLSSPSRPALEKGAGLGDALVTRGARVYAGAPERSPGGAVYTFLP